MWNDPIVEEVHAIRAQIRAELGNDPARIAAHFRALEERNRARMVAYPPRRPAGWMPQPAAEEAH